MTIKLKSITAFLDDNENVCSVEARRVATYPDGHVRDMPAEEATEEDFKVLFATDDVDVIAKFAAACDAAKSLEADLAAAREEIEALRASDAAKAETIAAQRTRIDELTDSVAGLGKRVEEGLAREQQAARELSALQAAVDQAPAQ